jgi:alpha-L-fucosidase
LTYLKTPYDLIEMTVKANALDGNFVINFGPDGDGNIRPEETKIAKSVGNWMAINGSAVYGVQHSVLEKQDWGYSTQKGDAIYLIVFNKPVNNILKLKVPRCKEKNKIYVIENAVFVATKKAALVRDGGRDKFDSFFYDLTIPSEIQKLNEPFVIEIKLKQVDKSEKGAYQQALT